MIIRASADIRANYNDVIEECRQSGEPIYLTKNGQGDAVVMDLETFERREQVFKAQQMVLEAYIENLSGAKTYSTEEVVAAMEQIVQGD